MKTLSYILLGAVLFGFSATLTAAEKFRSDYAGQQKRAIKSLSAQDIEQLRNGKGWGLAKAAELNGMPGPKHILEMAQQIQLTAQQRVAIEDLFQKMKASAVPLGRKLIEAEKRLNDAFAARNIDEKRLKAYLADIATITRELRFVHLSTHLATPNILTAQQIRHYNQLRGYTDDDPCKSVPSGHDPAMWKQHNNCS